jgi:hypothetical protein
MASPSSEQEKEAAQEIRDSLRDLERTAKNAQLGMLGYLLGVAILEADRIIGDETEPPTSG